MSASARYSALLPFGASITANDSGSPTATPARRYPGGARSGVGVGAAGVSVAVGLGGGSGTGASRRHSQNPDTAINSSKSSRSATRCGCISDHPRRCARTPVAGRTAPAYKQQVRGS